MLEKTAYLLVYHGSRDPRPQQEMDRLAEQIQSQLAEQSVVSPVEKFRTAVLTKPPQPLVYTAALELAPLPLESAIAQLSEQLAPKGITELQILPLFLLPGVHVREDIPEAVKIAQQMVETKMRVTLKPYLGQSPLMARKLQATFSDVTDSARIIISHGSRRQGGNQPLETLAQQVGAKPAYWSVSPTLTEQITGFVEAGISAIEIMPYFLFPGGITDAIAQEVQTLKAQFQSVHLHFGRPLSRHLSLADLIIKDMIL
ncbi:MAG: sirohydrochlorin chelatase [Halothece sp. Uz-M2-17]|nr:sirohydrochlorin chelatase [Halothece sp. Uz-M2-17]